MKDFNSASLFSVYLCANSALEAKTGSERTLPTTMSHNDHFKSHFIPKSYVFLDDVLYCNR